MQNPNIITLDYMAKVDNPNKNVLKSKKKFAFWRDLEKYSLPELIVNWLITLTIPLLIILCFVLIPIQVSIENKEWAEFYEKYNVEGLIFVEKYIKLLEENFVSSDGKLFFNQLIMEELKKLYDNFDSLSPEKQENFITLLQNLVSNVTITDIHELFKTFEEFGITELKNGNIISVSNSYEVLLKLYKNIQVSGQMPKNLLLSIYDINLFWTNSVTIFNNLGTLKSDLPLLKGLSEKWFDLKENNFDKLVNSETVLSLKYPNMWETLTSFSNFDGFMRDRSNYFIIMIISILLLSFFIMKLFLRNKRKKYPWKYQVGAESMRNPKNWGTTKKPGGFY
ncbi:MAG: hypothetical protein ACRC4M_04865 [Mycoplasma sp.]